MLDVIQYYLSGGGGGGGGGKTTEKGSAVGGAPVYSNEFSFFCFQKRKK